MKEVIFYKEFDGTNAQIFSNIYEKRAPPSDHIDPMVALPLCLKVKIRLFPYVETPRRPTWEIYCPYTEKPPQAITSPILNPNSCAFGNAGKDSADRTTPPPGNSACRDGHSPCIACYTGVCRSRPGRTPIPDAISCSGS